nr:reverse transcriptase domain-containing protein [Tanacetum cinerariifolium]
MREEDMFRTPIVDPRKGPSSPQPEEPLVATDYPNHTPHDHVERQPEETVGDPIMQPKRQRHDEPLWSYLERFGKETLHMTDRSDSMLTGAFISGLRPGRLFKDLIARPPSSMEELFTLVNSFVRAEEANIKNRLCESKLEPIDSRHGQNSRDQHKQHKDKYAPRTGYRPNNHNNPPKPTFTPLLKSPAEIYATTEGKAALRPPQRMFTRPHRRDRTRYCEFHGDHGHDTNSCVDLRKEIEACIRNGRFKPSSKGCKRP